MLQWSKITAPTAAHIHEGRAGVAGPVVVLFFQPGTNAASLPDTLSSVAGCVDVDPALARRIAANPRDYYVNIHTADFAAGAIRGQLHRARHLDLDLPRQLTARLNGANEVPPGRPRRARPGPGPDRPGAGLLRPRLDEDRPADLRPHPRRRRRGHRPGGGPVLRRARARRRTDGRAPRPSVSAAAGCVGDQDPALLRDIRRHPADYYVNVHNLEFVPGGPSAASSAAPPRDIRGADGPALGRSPARALRRPGPPGVPGGSAVLVAASWRPSSATDVSRILNFCTLPVTVMGKASTNLQ